MLPKNIICAITLSFFLFTLSACGGGDSSEDIANQKPIVNAGIDQLVDAQASVTLNATASDPDGSITDYQWTQTSGSGVSIANATSLSASFTAPDVQADEVLIFKLTVTDNDAAQSTDSVKVEVNRVNTFPIVSAGADQIVDEQTQVSLIGTASDPDGSVVNYQWAQISGIDVVLNDADTLTSNFTAPNVGQDEELSFKLTVTDNEGATATSTTHISILRVNALPIINAGSDQTVTEGDTVTLNGLATDPDGTVVSYEWLQISGTTTSLQDSDTATATFVTPVINTDELLSFQFSAIDNDGAEVSDTLNITIKSVSSPPTLDAGAEQVIFEQSSVILKGSANANGSIIIDYQWQQIAGTSVILKNSNTDTASFDIPNNLINEVLIFELTVTNNQGVQAKDSTNLIITDNTLITDLNFSDPRFSSCISGSAYRNGWIYAHEVEKVECWYDNEDPVEIREIAGIDKLFNLITFSIEGYEELSDISAVGQLNSLESLTVSYSQVKDISVLSNLTLLKFLDLSVNRELTDISALEHIHALTSLKLSAANITSLAPIENLTSLITLDLSGNHISDITPIANLKALTHLYLSENNISSLSALAELDSLVYLDLYNNKISDISPLSGLDSLKTLVTHRNLIAQLSGEVKLPRLEHLTINYNQISRIDNLTDGMPKLVYLNLSNNPITSISGLSNHHNLETINLNFCPLAELSNLSNMSRLKTLNLQQNVIKSIHSLSNLPLLQELNLDINEISEIKSLQELTSLKRLNLTSNKVSNLSSLSNLPAITTLNLSSNNITSLKDLSNLPNIEYLDLSDNKLIDIDNLNSFPELKKLLLLGNNIKSLPAITNQPKLSYLDFTDNQISSIAKGSNLPELLILSLRVNNLTELSWAPDFSTIDELDLSYNQISHAMELGSTDINRINLYRNSNIPCTEIDALRKNKNILHECPE